MTTLNHLIYFYPNLLVVPISNMNESFPSSGTPTKTQVPKKKKKVEAQYWSHFNRIIDEKSIP